MLTFLVQNFAFAQEIIPSIKFVYIYLKSRMIFKYSPNRKSPADMDLFHSIAQAPYRGLVAASRAQTPSEADKIWKISSDSRDASPLLPSLNVAAAHLSILMH